MAKRIFTSQGLTFTAANAGTAAATTTFMALKGAASTQISEVLEIMVSGMASASTVAAMNWVRASTLETTPTTLASPHSDGPMHFATAVLAAPVVPFVAAATGPTPSTTVTDAKLSLALNLFGGIVRWNAAPTQQWTMIGNTAPGGESVLHNNLLGGGASGLANAHIIYEPY